MNSQASVSPLRKCPLCGRQLDGPLNRDKDNASCSNCGNSAWFRIQEFGDTTIIINVLPSLDLEKSNIARVVDFISRHRSEAHVIINLSSVEYIGSTFLDGLIVAKRSLAATNGRFILCGFNPVIEEVFRVTKLDGFFEIVDLPV